MADLTDTTSTPGSTPGGPVQAASVPAAAAAAAKPRTPKTAKTPKAPRDARVGSLWSDARRELLRNPIFLVATVLILILVATAVRPQLFTSINPYATDACQLRYSLQRPSAGHWFGYDFQGCDLYARVVYGARASISVGILVTVFAALIGGVVGALSGFYGGWLDGVLSRIADVFLGLPLLLGGVVFLTVFTFRGIWGVVLALTLLGWPMEARIMRSTVVATKNADYIHAARALGAGTLRILGRHILPNSVAPVIVVATISLGVIIATEATLSYLGIGLQPPTISWGIMIADAQARFLQAPHILLFPAAALSLTVLSFILLGDAVRDALDPKLR